MPEYLKEYDDLMTVEEREALYNIARKLERNSTIVEIGSFKGGGTLTLCEGAPQDTVIHCVDHWDYIYDADEDEWSYQPHNDITYQTFLENTKNFDDIIVPHRGKSKDIAKDIDLQKGDVDLLFIDAEHTYEGTIKHLNAWFPKLERGIIVVHDIRREGCWRAIEEYVIPDTRQIIYLKDNLFAGRI